MTESAPAFPRNVEAAPLFAADVCKPTRMLCFTVDGLPVPQGSMKGFFNMALFADLKHLFWKGVDAKSHHQFDEADECFAKAKSMLYRGIMITSDNTELKHWRKIVTNTAENLRVAKIDKEVAASIQCDFYFARPASVSAIKRPFMVVRPDLDKLTRAILDAMTGVMVFDDSQFVEILTRKHYGTPERVDIKIGELR